MTVSVFEKALRHFKVIAVEYTANTAYGREGCDKKRHGSALSAMVSKETLIKLMLQKMSAVNCE